MSDETKKHSFLYGLLIKIWETTIEKLLVPIVMAAIVGVFGVWQQKASEKTVDAVYQKVAQTINKELPANLEALRKQVNEQGEALNQVRAAVLEIGLRHRVEDELRRAERSRTRPVGQPRRPEPPPASQPAEVALKALKARPVHKAMPPMHQTQLPARLLFK